MVTSRPLGPSHERFRPSEGSDSSALSQARAAARENANLSNQVQGQQGRTHRSLGRLNTRIGTSRRAIDLLRRNS